MFILMVVPGVGGALAPEDALAKEMTHDLEVNFNKIAPFGKEDTAKELQQHAAKTQDTLVDAVENAEVAEIKRAVFRALTRLRAATIKEFDTILGWSRAYFFTCLMFHNWSLMCFNECSTILDDVEWFINVFKGFLMTFEEFNAFLMNVDEC